MKSSGSVVTNRRMLKAMKRSELLIYAALCFSMSGCALADLVFCAFSNAYSGGGFWDTERRAHFNKQWETGLDAARQDEFRQF